MNRLIAYLAFLLLLIPALKGQDSMVVRVDSLVLHKDSLSRQLSITPDKGASLIASGVCGEIPDSPFRVKVSDQTGSPVAGIEVAFRIISQPGQSQGSKLNKAISITDSSGYAAVELTLGSKPGSYRVSCRIREGFPDNEVIYEARARRKNWVYMLLVGLFGGLGLFLFGMHTMSEGMQQSAGERLRSILGNVTRNRLVGAGIGTIVTTVIQSSSATSVMLVSFVNANLLQFRQTIPVLLGAAIGTTITAQMIAFKITEYSLLLVAAGFFLQAFSKREQLKAAGSSIFGFGVLFFGMHIMSDAMAPLREWAPFIDLLLKLENPVLGILVGAVFTALIQSSSAFVGIMIVLASQSLLSLDAAIPLLLGSNLGTPVTALLSSLKAGKEAKKVALAFLIIKFISVLIFAGWTTQLGKLLVQYTPEASLQRSIANAHTVINLVLMIVVLPFSPQVARLVDWMMGKSPEAEKLKFSTLYLDEGTISTPSLALNLAKQEIIRMGMIVRTMLSRIISPFIDKNPDSLGSIYTHEQEVNFLRDHIKAYLLKINKEAISSKRVEESFQMLYYMNEFEKIADIISGSLALRAEKWVMKDFEFSEKGKQELITFHQKIEKQLKRSLVVFDETNLQKAARMKTKHKEYRGMSRELEKQHYGRILEGMKESIDSSKTHLEILALLSSIDSHATNIARIALDWDKKDS
ncbi:MAG: Na/Pi symporter [Bacteroidota bacterium]